MKKVTVTAWASGSVFIQDTFPAEGTFAKSVPAGTTKSFFLTDGQYNHIQGQLDSMVSKGLLTSVLVTESEEQRSDELLELKQRVAMVVTLANTGLTVPNLVTLGVRKGDVCNVYDATAGTTLTYTVDEVNSSTVFTATGLVVAWDKTVADDMVYFTRDGVLIASTDRTIPTPAGGAHLTSTVSQAPYQKSGFGRFYVKASDGKPYFKTAAGAEMNLGMFGSDPIIFKGAIAANTDFPLIADVKNGWLYRVTADVTDNAGVTYTNTGQVFHAGAEIAWNGSNWTELGAAWSGQNIHESFQHTPGSETLRVFRALHSGKLRAVAFECGTVAGAAETMDFMVQIAGVNAMSAAVQLNNTTHPLADTPYAGTLIANPSFAAGDLITVIRTYVAGAGTLLDTVASIQVAYDL